MKRKRGKDCGDFWKHDYQKNAKGRKECSRCHRLNPIGVSAEVRFWDHVRKTETCWLWISGKNRDGYGLYFVPQGRNKHSKGVVAHRYSLKLAGINVPPFTPSACVDHICKVRACVRPEHLRIVSVKENTQRPFCLRGHDLAVTGFMRSDGRRRCRVCHEAYMRDRRKVL